MKNLIYAFALLSVVAGGSAFTLVNNTITSKAKALAFAGFLSHFEKIALPYEMGLADIMTFAERRRLYEQESSEQYEVRQKVLRQFIPELQRKRISRMGPPEVRPVARYYPNDKMVAVIYASFHPFMEDYCEFKLALFDLHGNAIPQKARHKKMMRAASFSIGSNQRENAMTFSIDSEGVIHQKEYRHLWKNDVKVHGTNGNEIVSHELVAGSTIQISDDGKIQKSGEVAMMKP